jgi:hypothetical protein
MPADVAEPNLRLDAPGPLLAPDAPESAAAAAAIGAELRAALRVRLASVLPGPGIVALHADVASALRALPGSGRVVAVGHALAGHEVDARVSAAQAFGALAEAPAWLALVPPESPDAVTALAELLAEARRRGVRILADETRTFGRVAPTSASVAAGLAVDAVLVGDEVAAGRTFAAMVGDVAPADAATDAACRAALATVVCLRRDPIHERYRERIQELREAVSAAVREQELQIAWSGSEAAPELRFVDQEGAPAELILHHFGLEAAAAGLRVAGPWWLPTAALRDGVQAYAKALRTALARIRTLLIEYNSYLSGGLPFVWAGGAEMLRARGAARYRYPRLGEVDVDAVGAAIRIAFLPHELGPVTSSGFYLPTRLVGDVDVAVRFELRRFDSGPDATCLGLFLQNEASSARYYAQVMCTADAPVARSAALGHAGAVIGRTPFAGDHGWLRLRRAGGLVEAWFRVAAEAPWHRLGSVPAVGDALIVGAKIWSKVRTEGLVADLFDLTVEAELAADQPPLLVERADPRDPAKRPLS